MDHVQAGSVELALVSASTYEVNHGFDCRQPAVPAATAPDAPESHRYPAPARCWWRQPLHGGGDQRGVCAHHIDNTKPSRQNNNDVGPSMLVASF